MQIRDALPEDAKAACQVLRQSITELCTADHQNNPAILAQWLSNKTPEIFLSWLTQPGGTVLVAVEASRILAVGSVTALGQITLNYVIPTARFQGVSRTLLKALEARALEQGNTWCTLNSTETAHRFYQANGYLETGPSTRPFGITAGYNMAKSLYQPSAVLPRPESYPAEPAPAFDRRDRP